MPSNSSPTLSIIVISFNPPQILGRCLGALKPQLQSGESELLVVGRWLDETALMTVKTEFPEARFLEAAAQETIPNMRRQGLSAARGGLVAFLEDDCIVDKLWCETIITAHEATPEAAVGGAVEPDNYARLLDWAVYFCEYARFMGPLAGTVAALSGNNVSYKRAELPALESMPNGLYEVLLHWQMQQNGRTLLADPRLAVTNIHRWRGANLSRIPFQHGRGFAAIRTADQPLWQRLFRAASTPLLPILQVGRIIFEVASRKRNRSKLLLALPLVFIYSASWAAGELTGYLFTADSRRTEWR